MQEKPGASRRPNTSGGGWLVSSHEIAVYAYALFAFWTYSTLTRVLVRAMWFKASPMAEATSPSAFALVHLALAPALVLAYAGAYQVGIARTRKIDAVAKHVVIVVFVLIMAKFSYLVIDFFLLYDAGESDIGYSLGTFWADPAIALGAAIELASLYCVGLLLAAGLVSWRRYHLEAISSATSALDAERSRSMALRRQLDPHSLYNTLNAISGSVRTAPRTAIQMLGSLGELLRLTLGDEAAESTLAEEFKIAAKYLALYQLRFPDKLSFRVDLADDCGDALIPPLLLQPLVENAALHGINAGCSEVAVLLKGAESALGRIEISISNTRPPGAVLVPPSQSSGIGLRNTWERLQLSYGDDFQLEWMPSEEGTAILRLDIPRVLPGPLPLVVGGARAAISKSARERRAVSSRDSIIAPHQSCR